MLIYLLCLALLYIIFKSKHDVNVYLALQILNYQKPVIKPYINCNRSLRYNLEIYKTHPFTILSSYNIENVSLGFLYILILKYGHVFKSERKASFSDSR